MFQSLSPKRDSTILGKIFQYGGEKAVTYKNMKTLSVDCEYFREETQE